MSNDRPKGDTMSLKETTVKRKESVPYAFSSSEQPPGMPAMYEGDHMKPRTIALFVGTGFLPGTLPSMSGISQRHAGTSSADAQMQRHNEAETRELEE